MKLQAIIAGSQVDLEVRRQGARVFATIDGRSYELELQRVSDQACLIIDDGRVFDCRVDGRLESGAELDVVVGANRHAITIIDPKRLRSASGVGGPGEGAARIVAPMPGKVVRLLVEAGQEVEAGHGIVVVEAMKMQNEMKSPKAGRIAEVKTKPGAAVAAGDVLVVVE
jgi:biotin carboxyl carrier protein